MMTKEKNKRISKSTLFGIFPVALLLAFVLSASFTGPVTEGTTENGIERVDASNTLPQDDPVFSQVDQMPAFKGGYDALVNYLVKNIQYPEDARKKNVEGKVFTTFVIEKDGRVTGARVLKSVDEQLDKEALRVVQEMPAWIPGKNNGKPVRVQFNLPIDFKLGDGKEKEKESSPSNTREGVKQYQKIKKDHESDGIH